MIRVLELLTTTAVGGGPQQVRHLARHLPAGEFEVTIAGPREPGLTEPFRAFRLEPAALALGTLRGFPLTLRRTARLIRQARAHVVHTHGKGAGVYGRLAARLARVPAVHTFHGIHYESYSRAGQRVYLALERRLAAITHTVINVSASQEVEALALGVARADRSVVVVNGIDVDELATRAPATRAELGLRDGTRVLGCVARFDPVKRHDALVRAFASIARRRPDVALLLIGDGPERARLAAQATELGIAPNRIVAPGELAWTANPYPSMDLYVAASRKEGLPLAPLEAMASELAVIATDVSGHRDVVEHGVTGLLVPYDHDAAMAGAIESLLDDPAGRRRMGQAGRARVLREFTTRTMAAKTADVYRAAAASR